ncbi:MAG: cytochrome c oxidase subunit II [Dehalococcoidia bacterium]
MSRRAILLTLLIGVIAAALVIFFLLVSFTPEAASTQAPPIDTLLAILFSIGSVILTISVVILIYNVIAFRRRPGDMEDGPAMYGHTPFQMLWVLVPLVIVIALSIYAALVLTDITKATSHQQELEVRVSAFQWGWLFEYPEYGLTTGELGLPVDRPVLVELTSQDVVHSFFVAEFRVKRDAVPGMEQELRFTPSLVGEFKVRCAELCGLAHTIMVAPTIVMTEGDFEQWVEEQRE